jgi:2-polyprenyl-3-methyl-5-hydroxy-6-metoxy-1,4-benzoquinol methylase
MIFHSNCPLCGSGNISFHLKCKDHLVSGDEFDLFKCPDCSFIFTQGYPDEDDIGSFYDSEDYVSHDDEATGLLNSIYKSARDVMLYRKRKMVERVTGLTKGRLLDIGCGTGYFAEKMKRYGWDVTGIEKSIKAREFAKSRFGLNILEPGRISVLSSEGFDCITLWHVLEHLHDPFRYAAEIKRLLKPDGFVTVALPNSDSADAQHYKNAWAAFDVPRHIWHFNPSTFRKFCEKTGFNIVREKRLPLDVFYISMLSEKGLGSLSPFLKGLIKGGFFTLKSAVDKTSSSSLVFFLQNRMI